MNALDKEEFRIKLEEINKLVQKKDYKGAMNIVDSIDWRRVKNVRTLCVVGEIYAANGRYEDSKEIFLLAYHKASIGKNILYRLIEISLRLNEISEAEEFFEEYRQVASNDNTQYILQYKIARAKKASLNEQIRILEEYKEQEFTEKWSYELAVLYYKAGDKEKCLDLCNEIILWFNEGKYVMKAYDLKMRMGELTGKEKEKFEKNFIPKLITPEEAKEMALEKEKARQEENNNENSEKSPAQADSEENQEKNISESEDAAKEENEEKEQPLESEKKQTEPEAPSNVKKADPVQDLRINFRDKSNMENIQSKISQGIRDIFGVKKNEFEDDQSYDNLEEAADSAIEQDIPEEIIKKDAFEPEQKNIPDLEAEPKKPGESPVIKEESKPGESKPKEVPDFSKTMVLPELKIPASMKNMEPEVSPKIPEVSIEDLVSGKSDSHKEFSFNLEDSILAAASAQGIEIPKEEDKKQTISEKTDETGNTSTDTEKVPDQAVDEVEELEEPDFLNDSKMKKIELDTESEDASRDSEMPAKTLPEEEEEVLSEEDLQSAEEEFLHGPAGKADLNLEDMDDIEEEDILDQMPSEQELAKESLTEEEELENFIESIQPKIVTDPRDIIPRERELREDEKQLFTYFVKVPGMKEQLVDALCDAQMAAADKTSKTGNIIVMGGKECGKTRLISGLIPAICKELNLEASKVAYVFADQINGKNIYKIFAKLAGGFLVIENANQLTQETVEMLDKAMEVNTDGLTVIIEDEKIGMRKLMARFPKFAQKFTSMINIPVFTNDELVNFARIYTKENGYTIDQMGMLALYNLIGINQKEDEPMNVGAVKELIDTAIAKSQGGIRKFKRNISKKRTDHDGYIVLYEKDFSK